MLHRHPRGRRICSYMDPCYIVVPTVTYVERTQGGHTDGKHSSQGNGRSGPVCRESRPTNSRLAFQRSTVSSGTDLRSAVSRSLCADLTAYRQISTCGPLWRASLASLAGVRDALVPVLLVEGLAVSVWPPAKLMGVGLSCPHGSGPVALRRENLPGVTRHRALLAPGIVGDDRQMPSGGGGLWVKAGGIQREGPGVVWVRVPTRWEDTGLSDRGSGRWVKSRPE